jgi:hypothetical protein
VALGFILGHIVGGAAFIADPPAFTVYPYRVQSAQNAAALSTNTDNRLKAITAKDILRAVYGMFPDRGILCFVTKITCSHFQPFFISRKLLIL